MRTQRKFWSLCNTEHVERAPPVRSLAGQFLAFQLVVVGVVLLAVAAVSVAQSTSEFREVRGQRMIAVAENVASTPVVRDRLSPTRSPSAAGARGRPRRSAVGRQPRRDRRPRRRGAGLLGSVPDRGAARISAPAMRRRAGPGSATSTSTEHTASSARSRSCPPTATCWRSSRSARAIRRSGSCSAAPGNACSSIWDWAPRSGWSPRGCCPAGSSGTPADWRSPRSPSLADHREALLHSIREGVVAVNTDGEITVLNDSAQELLGPHRRRRRPARRRRRHSTPPWPAVPALRRRRPRRGDRRRVSAGARAQPARGQQPGARRSAPSPRCATAPNWRPCRASCRRTRVSPTPCAPRRTSSPTSCTRSRVWSQLGEYDAVTDLVGTLTRRRAEISDAVTQRISDPAVAALLIAKTSLAAETRGVADAGPRLAPARRSTPRWPPT